MEWAPQISMAIFMEQQVREIGGSWEIVSDGGTRRRNICRKIRTTYNYK